MRVTYAPAGYALERPLHTGRSSLGTRRTVAYMSAHGMPTAFIVVTSFYGEIVAVCHSFYVTKLFFVLTLFPVRRLLEAGTRDFTVLYPRVLISASRVQHPAE